MKITQEEYEALQELYREEIADLKRVIHFLPNGYIFNRPVQIVAKERLHACHELWEDLQWAKAALLEGKDD